MSTNPENSSNALINQLLNKAWDNPEFKDALVANPMEAISSIMQKELSLPEGKEIIVVDQTDPSKYYLNIPIKPVLDDIELSEKDLELVAGGDSCSVRNAGVAAGEWTRDQWNNLVNWWNS